MVQTLTISLSLSSALLQGCTGCTDDDDRVPVSFQLVVRDTQNSVLVNKVFSDFESASNSAPISVIVTEGNATSEVLVRVNTCDELTRRCTGPLTLEDLVLTLDPFFENHIFAASCVGTEGSMSFGVDVTKTGNCR